MKQKKQTVNTNSKSEKPAKNAATQKFEDPAEYLCMLSAQMMPAISETIDRYFFEFNLAAKNDESIMYLADFLKRKGIGLRTWERWRLKNPRREEWHYEGMEAIGRRRELGAIKKEFAEKTVHHMMPFYSKDWADQQERQAKLGAESHKDQPLTVIMQSYKEDDQ